MARSSHIYGEGSGERLAQSKPTFFFLALFCNFPREGTNCYNVECELALIVSDTLPIWFSSAPFTVLSPLARYLPASGTQGRGYST